MIKLIKNDNELVEYMLSIAIYLYYNKNHSKSMTMEDDALIFEFSVKEK